jgi:hypothetical protein
MAVFLMVDDCGRRVCTRRYRDEATARDAAERESFDAPPPCAWWLVRADDAEAGRAIIAEAEKIGAACDWDGYAILPGRMVSGRVIDSGVPA